jgi:hypothetical protein
MAGREIPVVQNTSGLGEYVLLFGILAAEENGISRALVALVGCTGGAVLKIVPRSEVR